MKIRTDFVTNSSSSSFLAFLVDNKKLFDYFEKLGIKIERTDGNVLSDKMLVTLPSGNSCEIDGIENSKYPFLSDYKSVAAWLFGLLLWEFEDYGKEEGEYSPFTKELFQLLHDNDLLHHDWDDVEELTCYDISADLAALDTYDAATKSAEIVQGHGFEGDIRAERIQIKDGKMLEESFCFERFGNESDEVDEDELWQAMYCDTGKTLFDLAQRADLIEKETKVWKDRKWEAVSEQ